MQRFALNMETRATGKGIARKLRAAGHIPAVLYGKRPQPLALHVSVRDFAKIIKQSPDLNALFDITVDGKETVLALVRDHQQHVIRRNLTHIDFQQIDINDEVDVEVPIHLVGTPVGVKEEGGVLDQLRHKIHIKARPNKIPSFIEIDVSGLKIGDNIHANEVAMPEGVRFPHSVNYTIAAVLQPTKEETPAQAAAAAAATPAEGAASAPAEGAAPAAEKKA